MTKYIRELIGAAEAGQRVGEMLTMLARGELLEIERRRGILFVSTLHDRAWDVPYSEGALRTLIELSETGKPDAIVRAVRALGGLELASSKHFNARHYSEVVVA